MITLITPLPDGRCHYTDRPGHPCTDADADRITATLAAAGIRVECRAGVDGLHLHTGPLPTGLRVRVLAAVKRVTDSRIWWETPS